MSACMFGWDLIYKLAEKDIKKKEDILLVLVHWFLVKNGLKCVGLGDNKTVPEDEGSEALPEGWNKEPVYALRYVYKNKLYILHGTKSEDDIIFNLMRASDMVVSNVTFNVEDTVKKMKGPLNKTIPNYSTALNSIKKDLVEPVFLGKTHAVSTQTSDDPVTGPDVLPSRRYTEEQMRPHRPNPEIGRWDPLRDPLAVGRSDLDPFSRGGGMIFDPFGPPGGPGPDTSGIPGGLPRGSVPPGARFDPVGPPLGGIGRGPIRGPTRGPGRGQPDFDHLPPPGYDDMFM